MLRYLRAAFLVRQRVPLLGDVPVNLLLLAATAVLGLAHPAFWLLGVAAEIALLWSLVGNRRYRKLVDAAALQSKQKGDASARQEIEPKLEPTRQSQLANLRQSLARIEQDYANFSPDDPTAAENLRNLRELETCYFKLLLAQQHLSSEHKAESTAAIAQQLAELQQTLTTQNLPSTLRSSQEATRDLLQRRLAARQKHATSLSEISSDLTRIEAQVSLAADAAAVHAKPDSLSFDLDFASSMIALPELYQQPTQRGLE
jgi:hypothetical protein